MMANSRDGLIIYPQIRSGDLSNTTYSGDWRFNLYAPNDQKTLELWDGDFDRGTNATVAQDTDDANTSGVPVWATTGAQPEAAYGQGNPADDFFYSLYRREPPVKIELIDPGGSPVYTNDSPSGTEEWEDFIMSTDAAANPDLQVQRIQPGFYMAHIQGLDLFNTVWLRTNLEICDCAGCGPSVWPNSGENFCPRTVSYWKHDVNLLLIKNQTNGAKESQETMAWALKNVANSSPLFRSGINICKPVAIANPLALTAKEADAILGRTKQSYKDGKANCDSSTDLAQALQQNLAAWLNLGSSKIGPNAWVILQAKSGTYEGTVMGALLEAQNIILNGGDLVRAKELADLLVNGLNSGKVDTDVPINLGPNGEASCEIYAGTIPSDKQPPAVANMPLNPECPVPPIPPVIPPEECSMVDYNRAGGAAILALNPAGCQGEQNGLLFHGTSSTTVNGLAFSNGCLRSVGTHSVTMTNGKVQWVGENFGNMELITPPPEQVTTPMTYQLDPPDCNNPAAKKMNGKDFKKDVKLEAGLYCISGNVTINAQDTVVGNGVTLYMLDGKFTINGGAYVQLSAPSSLTCGDPAKSPAPALLGVLIYMPGSQGSGQKVQINGNSDSYFEGTIYAPGSDIAVLGTGQVYASKAQFIGWNVEVGGTADIKLDFWGSGLPTCPDVCTSTP